MFCLENNLKLKDNEEVLFIARPGISHYKFRIACFLLLILIPAFFCFFLITQGIEGISILATVPLLAFLYGARILVVYYYNVYILTNERLIGIEQKGFFEKLIMDIKISHIREVNFFKKNSLCLELLDGKKLILDKIDDREYMYELFMEQIGRRHNREVGFTMRKIS